MKAAALNQIGDDNLELCDDVSTVDPGPGEVRASRVFLRLGRRLSRPRPRVVILAGRGSISKKW